MTMPSLSPRTTILICILLLAAACREQQHHVPNMPGQAISGLAIPIRLQVDTTRIQLLDFFEQARGISSVVLGDDTLSADSAGTVLVIQPSPSPVINLNIIYDGISYDIPVFASEKIMYRFTWKAPSPDVQEVALAGSMNGWNPKATPLRRAEGDATTWEVALALNPGLYQYRLWVDGVEMLDPQNPDKIDNGLGGFNSTFTAGAPLAEAPRLLTESFSSTAVNLISSKPLREVYAYFENHRIPASIEGHVVNISLPAAADTLSRSHIRVIAHDGAQRTNDILIPLEQGMVITRAAQVNRHDLHGTVMYFMMVDRFFDGEPGNNRPTADPSILPKANNLGGDIRGITRKIEDGYFRQLGVNTLWISPISQNAEGAWGLWNKGVTSTFSAYHGYWPTALRRIDNRFGTEEEFRELLRVAHDHGMNVILDYVAHHVHQNHPLYASRPEWSTPLYLPDGTMNTEKWDEHRLTTWFDTFLPTWDFSRPEVVDALSDTAMYWVQEYDLDGFRHDATKHIREEFWRALTRKTRAELRKQPGRKLFQIGETYGSAELISSYIGSGMMDAQFDFNLYDAAVDAFARPGSSFTNLERVLLESMRYYGHHHLMGNITGNQDRARFISYADGTVQFDEDAKLAGWTRTITNHGREGFSRSASLMAFLMTTPGIPCIYYGDEIGMPGGNDPDNRRMMVFDQWDEDQSRLQEITSNLVNLRRSNLALAYGDLVVLQNDGQTFAYARKWFDEVVVVIFSSRAGTVTISLPEWIQDRSLARSVLGHETEAAGQRLTVIFEEPGAAVLSGT